MGPLGTASLEILRWGKDACGELLGIYLSSAVPESHGPKEKFTAYMREERSRPTSWLRRAFQSDSS